ncbi:hypothetical protein V6N13_037429 [Hibiscus sabdariffa]|uniref:Uncharacterized protein n=1 Tax=Hibiscus sabdariffa TaxID=183260 RepID=A0ABR2E9D5_9ROSI
MCLTTCYSLTTVCNKDRGLGPAIASFCRDLSRRRRAIHSGCYIICRASFLQQAAIRDWPPFPAARYVVLYVLFNFVAGCHCHCLVATRRPTLRRRHPNPIPASTTA